MIDVPVVVWMLRGLFSDIPKETYDAAEVFGASEMQIFRKIALPMIILGIVATAIFSFVLIWNEFIIANTLTGPVTKTISVGIWNGMGDQFGIVSIDADAVNAAGFLAFLPAIALFLAIKKYLAKGFSFSYCFLTCSEFLSKFTVVNALEKIFCIINRGGCNRDSVFLVSSLSLLSRRNIH